MSHFQAHSYQQAAILLTKVVDLEPKDARGYNNLGLCYESTGHYEEAKQVVRAIMSLSLDRESMEITSHHKESK